MSTFMLMLRLLVALAFVGGLLWFMARSAKAGRFSFLLGGGPTQESLEITSQRPLGRNVSVALVRAGDRHLLLGVSEHGVQLLAEGDDLCTPIPSPGLDEIHDGHDDHIDLAELTAMTGDGATTEPRTPEAHSSTSTHSTTTNRQAAPKHLSAMFTPTQPRMTLIESLRELTVRKT